MRPPLKTVPLPLKLAGGLFLFATSVPPQLKAQAAALAQQAQQALRADPIVTMELGAGVEVGGVFASAASDDGSGLVINCQLSGGNVWAECTAFGVATEAGLELVDLSVANMDAAMQGQASFTLAPTWRASAGADLVAGKFGGWTAESAREAALEAGASHEEAEAAKRVAEAALAGGDTSAAAAAGAAAGARLARARAPEMSALRRADKAAVRRALPPLGLARSRVSMAEGGEEGAAAEEEASEGARAAASSLEDKMSRWEAREAEGIETRRGTRPRHGRHDTPVRRQRRSSAPRR